MKNLHLAFFTLLAFSFSQLSLAYGDDDKIGLSLGGYLGASMLKPNASYTNYPAYQSGQGPAETDRPTTTHQKRANVLTTMGVLSYRILDWLEVEGQIALNLGDKTLAKNVYLDKADGNSTGTLKVNTNAAGVFSVFRFGGDAYVKGKIGLGVNMTEYKTGSANEKLTDFGLAAGIAVGHKAGPGYIEFQYMRYPHTRIKSSKVSERFAGSSDPLLNTCKTDIANNNPQSGYACSNLSMSSKQHLGFFSVGYIYTF